MKVEALAIPEVKLVTPPKFGDARGFFSETWQQERFAEAGIPGPFIQDNHSVSLKAGTIRGLHCQVAPSVQGKLVRVARGAVWDVAVDIRQGSPTFGRHVAATFVQTIQSRTGMLVGCPEEVAFRMGFIDADMLREQALRLGKTELGRVLLELAEGEG